MTKLPYPFSGDPPEDVLLRRAPLVRVVAQVMFPPKLKIGEASGVADFQDRVAKQYPFLQSDEVQHVEVRPNGQVTVLSERIWRLRSLDDKWRLTLSKSFLALDTSGYVDRTDFVDRFRHVASALEQTIDPQFVGRLGLRYINRVSGEGYAQLPKLIKPEVLGLVGKTYDAVAQHIMTEAIFKVQEGEMLARWGRLPPGGTVDSEMLPPITEPCWLLDLDVFETGQQWPFTAASIENKLLGLARRNYAVFRSLIQDDFLRFHGGDL